MPPDQDSNNSLVLSYLGLRKAVGTIGILLPFTLVMGKIILENPGILDSISSYYYSIMGDVFVGSLCAIGVFLGSYRGYEKTDTIAGKLAAVLAIGVAFFPTTPPGVPTAREVILGNIHLFFAACFFLTLAFFALFLFRKTNPDKPMTPMKLLRNYLYAICGYGILLSIALIVVVNLLPTASPVHSLMPVFWLESLAIVLFGISWFIKGEAILKDQ